jgi:hypothetical protein
MKAKITVAMIPALWLSFAGHAQEPSAKAEVKGITNAQGAIEVATITATVKVTAVDRAKRTVTLANDALMTKTFELGNAVRNVDQIKVGDRVKATVLESVAVAVRKSSAPPDTGESGTVAVTPKGAAPDMIMAKTNKISGKVVGVDTVGRTVTLEGPKAGTRTIKVGPEAKLDDLQKGDDVTLRVIAALAIRVEKP